MANGGGGVGDIVVSVAQGRDRSQLPEVDGFEPIEEKPKGTRINTVARAARLLMLVSSLPSEQCTASNLSVLLETSVPSTYHMLSTLVDAKFLYRDAAKRYHLGFHVGLLGEAYRRQHHLAPELLIGLQNLASATGESVYFSMWRDGRIEIAAKLAGNHAVQVANLEPGFQGAAHARASGKVLLAYADEAVRTAHLALHPLVAVTEHTITDRDELDRELETVRRNGYAVEEREFSPDVACVAVPVIARDNVLGAYTISAPLVRYRRLKRAYIADLLDAAQEATKSIRSL